MTTLFNPKESLLTIAGAQFNPSFQASELIGSNDSLNTIGIDPVVSGGKEAMCRVTMNKTGYAGAAYSAGAVYQRKDSEASGFLYFNKFNIGDLATAAASMFKLHFVGYKPTTVSAILGVFKSTFGIELLSTDVYNNSIVWSGDTASVLLEANPNSMGFKGSATINLVYIPASEAQGAEISYTLGSSPQTLVSTGEVIGIGDRIYSGSGINWLNIVTGATGNTNGHPSAASIPAYSTMCWTYYDGYIYRFSNRGRLIRLNIEDTSVVELATSSVYANFGSNVQGACVIATNGKIIIYGGSYNTGSSVYLGTVQIYDIESNTWSSGLNGDGVVGHSVAKFNGKMYVCGGRYDAQVDATYPGLRVYDPAANTWSTPIANFVTGTYFLFINHQNRLYVAYGTNAIGGSNNGLKGFNPVNNTNGGFYTFGAPDTRQQAGLASIGDTLYVVGGIRADSGAQQTAILTFRP